MRTEPIALGCTAGLFAIALSVSGTIVARTMSADPGIGPDTVELVPYGSNRYRSLSLGLADPLPVGFELPSFNDGAFTISPAPFGTPGGACPIQSTVKSVWPVNTRLLVRRTVNIPSGATNVRASWWPSTMTSSASTSMAPPSRGSTPTTSAARRRLPLRRAAVARAHRRKPCRVPRRRSRPRDLLRRARARRHQRRRHRDRHQARQFPERPQPAPAWRRAGRDPDDAGVQCGDGGRGTIRFGRTGIETAPVHSALEDWDKDGDLDLILQFDQLATGIQCGDVAAKLTAKTLGGTSLEGTDSIKTAGCK